jgi:hypothetical protein
LSGRGRASLRSACRSRARRMNVRMWTFAMLSLSVGLCVVGWPEARIGLVVNVALLTVLLAMPDLAAR